MPAILYKTTDIPQLRKRWEPGKKVKVALTRYTEHGKPYIKRTTFQVLGCYKHMITVINDAGFPEGFKYHELLKLEQRRKNVERGQEYVC